MNHRFRSASVVCPGRDGDAVSQRFVGFGPKHTNTGCFAGAGRSCAVWTGLHRIPSTGGPHLDSKRQTTSGPFFGVSGTCQYLREWGFRSLGSV